jgi:hypothetical protein
MSNRVAGLLAILAAAAWAYFWEFIRSLVYEQASKMLHPLLESFPSFDLVGALERFGPSAGLAGLGIYLFLRTKPALPAPRGQGQLPGIGKGVYVGSVNVDLNKLDRDLIAIISFIGYNGTGRLISINSVVQGAISCNGEWLPEPKLLSDRSPTQNLAAADQFMVVIEQRVPRDIADNILKRLTEKNDRDRVTFDLWQLDIFAFFPSDAPPYLTRLRIRDSFTVDEEPRRVMWAASMAVGPTDASAPTALETIPLFEAATIAYGRTRDRPIAILVAGLAKSPDGILTWYCDALTKGYDQLSPIKLFGNRPPARDEEEIYLPPYTNYEFVVEGNAVVFQEQHGDFRFENLRVYKTELDAAIQYLSALEM